MEKIKVFSKKSNIDIYLEFINEYLTVKQMADNYNRTYLYMIDRIAKGSKEYKQKYN